LTSVRPGQARSLFLRVAALALLLLMALVASLTYRTLQHLPDATIYFVRDEGGTMTLASVHRRLRPTDAADAASAAVRALALGPDAEESARGLASEVPPGTAVRSATLEGDVLVVDLTSDAVSGGGSASMIGRLQQLTYTLTQPSEVAAVELRVDGVRLDAWGGEGVMTLWPWRRPEAAGMPRW
jgi:spore germination protein GerM